MSAILLQRAPGVIWHTRERARQATAMPLPIHYYRLDDDRAKYFLPPRSNAPQVSRCRQMLDERCLLFELSSPLPRIARRRAFHLWLSSPAFIIQNYITGCARAFESPAHFYFISRRDARQDFSIFYILYRHEQTSQPAACHAWLE